MIKKLLFSTLLLISSSFAFCQEPMHKISGIVISEETKAPLVFAQVAIYPFGSSQPQQGTITNDKGVFQLNLEAGLYDLVIMMVGFEDRKFTKILLHDKSINLGAIMLTPSIKELEEVVVRGKKAGVVTGIEGLNIRADLNNARAGGSVLDILRSAPAVTITDEGTLALRGSSSTLVLVNGRNSTLSTDLEQIAASTVESIEIINNPNAKYDAQAEGGVINIKLKKEERSGTNGEAEFTIGTRYRMNSAVYLNHRTKTLNFRGGYNYKRWPRVEQESIIREQFSTGVRLEEYRSAGKSDHEHTIDWGVDYWFGKNTVTYEGVLNMEKEDEHERVTAKGYRSADLELQRLRKSHEVEDNYTIDNALVFEHRFDDSVREFKALASYSYRNDGESQHLTFFSNFKSPHEVTGRERALTNEKRSTTILKADYVQSVWMGKLNVGYKFSSRSADDGYTYAEQDPKTDLYTNPDKVGNRFVFKEQVHAAYFLYEFAMGNFEVSTGTRLEESTLTGKIFENGGSFRKSYLNLFPSLQAMYHLTENQSLKFTFSRRIDRPKAKRLNPFPDITDSLNIESGNPDLAPELIQSFELGHTIDLSFANFTYNFFYRHVAGEIDYILKIEDGVSYTQPVNLHSAKTYGFELITSLAPFPWWKGDASFAVLMNQVDGSNISERYVNSGHSWNAKLNSEFKLLYGLNLHLNASYTAPEVEAQGSNLAEYYLDVSLHRNFFQDRASLSIACRDLLNTLNVSNIINVKGYRQTTEEKKETRIFLATLDYKF